MINSTWTVNSGTVERGRASEGSCLFPFSSQMKFLMAFLGHTITKACKVTKSAAIKSLPELQETACSRFSKIFSGPTPPPPRLLRPLDLNHVPRALNYAPQYLKIKTPYIMMISKILKQDKVVPQNFSTCRIFSQEQTQSIFV